MCYVKKVNIHPAKIPYRYSMSTIWIFDVIKNKHDGYRGEDCMTKFCESLREQAKKITNFEKNQMIPLTNEQQGSFEKTKFC